MKKFVFKVSIVKYIIYGKKYKLYNSQKQTVVIDFVLKKADSKN